MGSVELFIEHVKKKYSYVCPDIMKEFGKWEDELKSVVVERRKNNMKSDNVEIGYERFLGPEILFRYFLVCFILIF